MDLVSIAMPGNSLFKSEQRDQLRLPDPVARTGMLHGAQWCMEGGIASAAEADSGADQEGSLQRGRRCCAARAECEAEGGSE